MDVISKYLVVLSNFTHNNNNNKASLLTNFPSSRMIQGYQYSWFLLNIQLNIVYTLILSLLTLL